MFAIHTRLRTDCRTCIRIQQITLIGHWDSLIRNPSRLDPRLIILYLMKKVGDLNGWTLCLVSNLNIILPLLSFETVFIHVQTI